MRNFICNLNPARVIFGAGTLTRLREEIERLHLQRALLLSTPQQAREMEALARRVGGPVAGVFAEAAMHTPVAVTGRALHIVRELQIDGLIAFGGGSTTGLAKALALRTDLPQIVIPTTYAGSEMTPILGETENGRKTTRRDPRILPEVVIYDVNLTLQLPSALSAVSGINAIAHAVEALYAHDGNPMMDLIAVEGIAALVRALPKIQSAPEDQDARADALYGAWLCGTCLGAVGMALHHKLCHTLGGAFDLPHAPTHAIILPHALAYNAPAITQVLAKLAPVLGKDPARALFDLARTLHVPRSLRDIGMPQGKVHMAVEQALASPYPNPRPLERAAITALVERAFAGEPPASIHP